jgi:hypothetical protein
VKREREAADETDNSLDCRQFIFNANAEALSQ